MSRSSLMLAALSFEVEACFWRFGSGLSSRPGEAGRLLLPPVSKLCASLVTDLGGSERPCVRDPATVKFDFSTALLLMIMSVPGSTSCSP
jgi:hypothetical protein